MTVKSKHSGDWADLRLLLQGSICTLMLSISLSAQQPYKPFPTLPPDDHHPWGVHDQNRPQPTVVTPGQGQQSGTPPSDAIVLFDGTNFSQWEPEKKGATEVKWILKEGTMECKPGSGSIQTKQLFGDCQLHLEWSAPDEPDKSGQDRGNSGIFLMGMCEIQILNNYQNSSYADGMAGAYYGMNPPLVNPLRPPGEFQLVDIVFRRPLYLNETVIDPGYVTVFMNGVVVQDHTSLEGKLSFKNRAKPIRFPDKGPLKLQDHKNPVRFRNIWYRPLPPRVSEGGTDGYLSPEATVAKRKEIAAFIREEAEKIQNPADPVPAMIRLMESLVYEANEAAIQESMTRAQSYVENLQKIPREQIDEKQGEIRSVKNAFDYLVKFQFLPSNFIPKQTLDKIVQEKGWEESPKK